MIECISISVYDTKVIGGDDPNILDYTEAGVCNLIYEGTDDKFTSLFASRLDFSLEVSIEDSLNELVYDYLFSGEENRYKVVIMDQDSNVIWTGFLLPDDYSEPYTTGTFFVTLTAVDGLGILKGVIFPDYYYDARHSVMKIIADCLRETGTPLEIWTAMAINNSSTSRWDNLFLNAEIWKGTDKNKNCYEILDDIITALGCTLFQQNNRWYVIGINRRGVVSDSYISYDENGVYIGIEAVTNTSSYIYWYDTPQLSLKPPFKEVSVTSAVNEKNTVFPDDIIEQELTIIDTVVLTDIPTAKYWKGSNLNATVFDQTVEIHEYLSEDYKVNWPVGYFVTALLNIDYPDNLTYYVSLKELPYVVAGQVLNIELEFDSSWNNPGDNDPWADLTNDLIMYTFTLNGTDIITNKPAFGKRSEFLLEFDNRNYGTQHIINTASIEIKDFIAPNNGFLDFKMFIGTAWYGDSPVTMGLKKFLVTGGVDNREFVRRRNLTRSNVYNTSIAVGDSVSSLVKNAFVYQPLMSPGDLTELLFLTYTSDGTGSVSIKGSYFASSSHYAILETYPDSVYVKRRGSDFYEYVRDIRFFDQGAGEFFVINFTDGYVMKAGDQLYVNVTSGDPQTSSVVLARENWVKTTNSTGADRYAYCLAEIMHDIYSETLAVMEGKMKGLIFPLDVLQFEIKNISRNFIPTRINIQFDVNETTATVIEYKNELVTGYE